MADTDTADYSEVRRMLDALRASWEPAEAHGAFCGRACLLGAAALQDWVRELASAANINDALAQEHMRRLQSVAAESLLSLEAGQMNFALLLPADDEPLPLRAAGLADWCHGFMHGLAVAGGADEGPSADALESAEAQEILADFSEITRAGADAESGEDDESAFAELVEYVRVSAQLIYEDTAPLRAQLSREFAES